MGKRKHLIEEGGSVEDLLALLEGMKEEEEEEFLLTSILLALKHACCGSDANKALLLEKNAVSLFLQLLNNKTKGRSVAELWILLGLVWASPRLPQFSAALQEQLKIAKPLLVDLLDNAPSSSSSTIQGAIGAIKSLFSHRDSRCTAAIFTALGPDFASALFPLISREPRSVCHVLYLANTSGLISSSTLEHVLPAVLQISNSSSLPEKLAALNLLGSAAIRNTSHMISSAWKVSLSLLETRRELRPVDRLACLRVLSALSQTAFGEASQKTLALRVLPHFVDLLESPEPKILEELPQILNSILIKSAYLQVDPYPNPHPNPFLQVVAGSSGVCPALANLFQFTLTPATQISVFKTLSALCSGCEAARRSCIKVKPFVEALIQSLSHESALLRIASAECVRSISSGASKKYRKALTDMGVFTPLFLMLSIDRDSTEALTSATAGLCNLLLDYEEIKTTFCFHEELCVLVELGKSSSSDAIRLNVVWSLKNLVFLAQIQVKRAVLEIVSFPFLFSLLQDSNAEVVEQVLNLLRNFVYGDKEDVALIVDTNGAELIRTVEAQFSSRHPLCVLQALYILCNVSTGSDAQKGIVMEEKVLKGLLSLISPPILPSLGAEIRIALVWVIVNLTWKEGDAQCRQSRLATLRRLGFLQALQGMRFDAEAGVRDRVQTALGHFHAEEEPPRPTTVAFVG